ncbi:MAG: hypothetical protein GKR89_30420 [Candidatus Latescibacteria bacterium]|nr:hypothetical protein [Candidatus Latescibacterota bacterium]
MRKLLRRIIAALLGTGLLLGASPARAHNGHLALALPVEGIRVDGELSDWPDNLTHYAITVQEAGAPLQGAQDLQTHFRLGYNAVENALYIAVEAQDDILVRQGLESLAQRPGQAQDGCEFYLDLVHPPGFTRPGQYWLRGDSDQGQRGLTGSFTGAMTWHSAGYRCEGRIDLNRLEGDAPPLQAGQILGFDLTLWDQDGDGAASRLDWGPGQDKYWTTHHIGDVVLVPSSSDLGTLVGQVVDADKGAAANDLPLRVYNRQLSVHTRTDASGSYRLDLPPGAYRLRPAQGAPTQAFEEQVQIEAGAITQVDLQAQPGPPLRGRPVFVGPGTDRPAGAGRLHWRTMDTRHGLPHNNVGKLLEDDAGHLWIGTRDGLARWDGQHLHTFGAAHGLPPGRAEPMLQDAVGHLWIGTGGGLARWNGQTFTTYTREEGLLSHGIAGLALGPEGDLWIGYWDKPGGLSRWDGRAFTSYPGNEVLPHYSVQSMATDPAGYLWIGTGAGLARWDGRAFTAYNDKDDLGFSRVYSLLVDRQSNLWLGNAGSHPTIGLARWDGESFDNYSTADGLVSNSIKSMAQDRAGHLWLAHWEGGLNRWDGQTFTTHNLQNGLPDDQLSSLLVDRTGQLWVGHTRAGLSHWGGRLLTTYRSHDGLGMSPTRVLAQDRDGHLWIGTEQGGLNRWDGRTFTAFMNADGLPHYHNFIHSLAVEAAGALWIGTGAGLVHWDGDIATVYTSQDGLPPGDITALAFDRKGHLWAGSTNGLACWDGQAFAIYTTAHGLPHQHVHALLVDTDDQLWIGTQGGLARWRDGRFEQDPTDLLPGQPINALAQDRTGHLWIGSKSGLVRWDGQTGTAYTRQQGLPNDHILALMIDTDNHLWIGTQGGLARSDGQVFQRLLKDDGLAGHAVRDLLQTPDGDVWIATDNGLTHYQGLQPTPPAVELTQAITDRPRPPVSPLRVPSSQTYLALEFRGASVRTGPEQLVYRYRLSGHQDQWRQTRDTRVAYTDLPEGNYQFQVEAIDPDLVYSAAPAVLDVEVFYQPVTGPLALDRIAVDDLFAAFYAASSRRPLGTAQVTNHAPHPVETTLRFFLPGAMRQPAEQTLQLEATSSQTVALTAALDPTLLNVQEPRRVQAEIGLVFDIGDQILTLEKKRELTIHPRNALIWDSVGRAAAFITSTDPQVQTFARSTLLAFEKESQSLGRPGRNLVRALVLFAALKEHGIRYLPDAHTPYARAAQSQAVDHIQYPSQLLRTRTGDCDDLTVLYAALLENAGIATALVDYPGHIFLLFDTGVPWATSYSLPIDERLLLKWGDRLWIPVEITRIDQDFNQAWQVGTDQLAQIPALELRQRLERTAEAWRQYPATRPQPDSSVVAPQRAALEAPVNAGLAALEGHIDAYLETHYRVPLAVDPDDDQLRTQFLKAYLALGRHDQAIDLALDHLIDRRANKAPIYNLLGNAYYLKGAIKQAILSYQQAAELRPQDTGIQRNLRRALAAVGKARPAVVTQVAAADTTKAGIRILDLEEFYWTDENL